MKIGKMFSLFVLVTILVSSTACAAQPQPTAIEPGPAKTEPSTEVEEATQMPTENASTVKDGQLLQSDLARQEVEIPQEDLRSLASEMNGFAFDLLQMTPGNKQSNFFFSPYSISLALAMAYAGAEGKTAEEMAGVLHFSLPQDQLHPTLNALDRSLYEVPEYLQDSKEAFQLNVANAIWGQQGYPFKQAYLDILAENYGAGLRLVDFISKTEQVRQTINDWVAEETEDKIKDLLLPGSLDAMTRLVLTNAIYFNATWENEFPETATKPEDFYLPDQSTVKVDMMKQTENYLFSNTDDLAMVEIPYMNAKYSMLVMMPKNQDLASYAAGLDTEQINVSLDEMHHGEVILSFPKFEYESSFSVADTLKELGMRTAFSPDEANFTGMYQPQADPLYISDVIHKAYVAVDEKGTEAAAATAIIMKATGAMISDEPVEIRFDHPFLFVIRDRESGLFLFIGTVNNPAK